MLASSLRGSAKGMLREIYVIVIVIVIVTARTWKCVVGMGWGVMLDWIAQEARGLVRRDGWGWRGKEGGEWCWRCVRRLDGMFGRGDGRGLRGRVGGEIGWLVWCCSALPEAGRGGERKRRGW